MAEPIFSYHPGIIAAYPNVVGGVIAATGLDAARANEPLRAAYLAEQEAVRVRIGATPLSEIPALSAWRRAFSAFGASPTQHRNAAEALLRRLTKKDAIPGINTLVDIGNLVSIRYALPVAVLDRRAIAGAITVGFAAGDEAFTELGADAPVHPEAGEVVFTDAQRIVHARRWCWRQSAASAATAATIDALVTIEAQHEHGRADVERALADMLTLMHAHVGGSYRHALLGADAPVFALNAN
jgi:DNA/RNA-binding domain of Phe-tRNA-synthetase-like protein